MLAANRSHGRSSLQFLITDYGLTARAVGPGRYLRYEDKLKGWARGPRVDRCQAGQPGDQGLLSNGLDMVRV